MYLKAEYGDNIKLKLEMKKIRKCGFYIRIIGYVKNI